MPYYPPTPIDTTHVLKAGDTMTGALQVNANVTANNGFLNVQGGTGDSNLGVYAGGATAAAFVSMYTNTVNYMGLSGWDNVGGNLMWRIGNSGFSGLSLYTNTGGTGGGTTTRALSIDYSQNTTLYGNLTLLAKNLITDTTTGTQIGTATTQKLAFFGSTPVVQQTGNIATALSTLGLVTLGKVAVGDITATGTPSATTFLRGDGTWSTQNFVDLTTAQNIGGLKTFTAVGSGTQGSITTSDITIVPNSGISPSASMFLNNQAATPQIWEFYANAAGAFGVFDKTNSKNGFELDASTENFTMHGNLTLSAAGNKLNIAVGTNASAGTALLAAGTITVSTTAVTANSLILLTTQASGTLANLGTHYISAKTAGTSFVISSSNILDNSTVAWLIVN